MFWLIDSPENELPLILRSWINPHEGSDEAAERAFNLSVKFNEARRKIENETQQQEQQ